MGILRQLIALLFLMLLSYPGSAEAADAPIRITAVSSGEARLAESIVPAKIPTP